MTTGTDIALLFPGQGSQTPDMRDHVARELPDLLERVTELVGEDPFKRVDESTRFAQPAIFCASVAGWTALWALALGWRRIQRRGSVGAAAAGSGGVA